MNFKKSQSGRSMVEMLGVLAIIGVLSVGGIAGYSLSMRRHRANQIVDVVSKYYLVAYSQCQQKLMNGEIPSLASCNIYSGDNEPYKIPKITEAGIGALPAGLTGVESVLISTNTTTGVDRISAAITFSDQKLCQAFASIVGKECEENSGINYFVDYSINQN